MTRAPLAAGLLLAALLAAGSASSGSLVPDAAPVPGPMLEDHCPPAPPTAFLLCFVEEVVCNATRLCE